MQTPNRQAPPTDGRKSMRLMLSDDNVRRIGNISSAENLKLSWLIDAILAETPTNKIHEVVDAVFPEL